MFGAKGSAGKADGEVQQALKNNQINVKYQPPLDPFEVEAELKMMVPTQKISAAKYQEWATQARLQNPFIDQILAEDASSHAKDDINRTFVLQFMLWLQGKSGYNLKYDMSGTRYVTPWTKQPITFLPGCKEYLRSFLGKKSAFQLKIAELYMRGPRDLNEAFLYYKYIVVGNILQDEDFLGVAVDQYFPNSKLFREMTMGFPGTMKLSKGDTTPYMENYIEDVAHQQETDADALNADQIPENQQIPVNPPSRSTVTSQRVQPDDAANNPTLDSQSTTATRTNRAQRLADLNSGSFVMSPDDATPTVKTEPGTNIKQEIKLEQQHNELYMDATGRTVPGHAEINRLQRYEDKKDDPSTHAVMANAPSAVLDAIIDNSADPALEAAHVSDLLGQVDMYTAEDRLAKLDQNTADAYRDLVESRVLSKHANIEERYLDTAHPDTLYNLIGTILDVADLKDFPQSQLIENLHRNRRGSQPELSRTAKLLLRSLRQGHLPYKGAGRIARAKAPTVTAPGANKKHRKRNYELSMDDPAYYEQVVDYTRRKGADLPTEGSLVPPRPKKDAPVQQPPAGPKLPNAGKIRKEDKPRMGVNKKIKEKKEKKEIDMKKRKAYATYSDEPAPPDQAPPDDLDDAHVEFVEAAEEREEDANARIRADINRRTAAARGIMDVYNDLTGNEVSEESAAVIAKLGEFKEHYMKKLDAGISKEEIQAEYGKNLTEFKQNEVAFALDRYRRRYDATIASVGDINDHIAYIQTAHHHGFDVEEYGRLMTHDLPLKATEVQNMLNIRYKEIRQAYDEVESYLGQHIGPIIPPPESDFTQTIPSMRKKNKADPNPKHRGIDPSADRRTDFINRQIRQRQQMHDYKRGIIKTSPTDTLGMEVERLKAKDTVDLVSYNISASQADAVSDIIQTGPSGDFSNVPPNSEESKFISYLNQMNMRNRDFWKNLSELDQARPDYPDVIKTVLNDFLNEQATPTIPTIGRKKRSTADARVDAAENHSRGMSAGVEGVAEETPAGARVEEVADEAPVDAVLRQTAAEVEMEHADLQAKEVRRVRSDELQTQFKKSVKKLTSETLSKGSKDEIGAARMQLLSIIDELKEYDDVAAGYATDVYVNKLLPLLRAKEEETDINRPEVIPPDAEEHRSAERQQEFAQKAKDRSIAELSQLFNDIASSGAAAPNIQSARERFEKTTQPLLNDLFAVSPEAYMSVLHSQTYSSYLRKLKKGSIRNIGVNLNKLIQTTLASTKKQQGRK